MPEDQLLTELAHRFEHLALLVSFHIDSSPTLSTKDKKVFICQQERTFNFIYQNRNILLLQKRNVKLNLKLLHITNKDGKSITHKTNVHYMKCHQEGYKPCPSATLSSTNTTPSHFINMQRNT